MKVWCDKHQRKKKDQMYPLGWDLFVYQLYSPDWWILHINFHYGGCHCALSWQQAGQSSAELATLWDLALTQALHSWIIWLLATSSPGAFISQEHLQGISPNNQSIRAINTHWPAHQSTQNLKLKPVTFHPVTLCHRGTASARDGAVV